jgi:Nif-specific regulatory protein
VFDSHSIGRLLLEAGRISKDDYSTAVRQSRDTGRSPHEILISNGKISVDELVQAITILMDITFLKEAVDTDSRKEVPQQALLPLGSYLERISLLFKTAILMSTKKSVSSLTELLIREAPSVMNAERATIFLADFERRELYSHLGVGLTFDQIRIPWDSGVAGWVFTHGKPLNIAEPYEDPRFNRDVDARTGFRTTSLLCVPLRHAKGSIMGVFQVLNKRAGVFTPTDLEILEILASQAARSLENVLELDQPRDNVPRPDTPVAELDESLRKGNPLDDIVGTSPVIQEIHSLTRRVAPTETTVLIQGESGTGKELVARAIHALSRRATGPMITLNCAAVPSELIESELFGHKRGAFTGAMRDHEGVFRSAHGGTLFLDEIEATPPAMQVKLLRAIQMGEVKPVGDNISQHVDVRLIAATNQDLAKLTSQGKFREDLFYRIHVFPIVIPPLRDRADDIPILVEHFLDKYARQADKDIRVMDAAALKLLIRYPWPGNIRELENEIERAVVLTPPGGTISVRSLSSRIPGSLEQIVEEIPAGNPGTLKHAVDDLERKMIVDALQSCSGNRSLAAKRLGLSRQGLLNKLHKFDLNNH